MSAAESAGLGRFFPRLRAGCIVRWRHTEYAQEEDVVVANQAGKKFAIGVGNARVLSLADGSLAVTEIASRLGAPEATVASAIDALRSIGLLSLEESSHPSEQHSRQYREVGHLVSACRSAIWHITRKCNQGCSHCYYLKDTELPSGFTRQEIEEIAKGLGLLGVEVVTLTGGEVSIAKDSLETAAAALEHECIPFRINTNGTGKLDFFQRLAERSSYLRSVQVSIDGPREHHDRLRVHDGAYDRVTAFARGWAGSRVKVRVVSMLTPEWSDPDIVRSMFAEIRNLSPVEWLIEVPSATGRWMTGLTTRESNRIYAVAKALVDDCIAYGPRFNVSLNQVFDWPPRPVVAKTLADTICSHDLGLLSFGPEGVSFCTLFMDSFGSQWKGFASPVDELARAWKTIGASRVSRRIGDNPACKACDLFEYCQGGCPGQYESPLEFSGCDRHSRTLAMVKKRILSEYPCLGLAESV